MKKLFRRIAIAFSLYSAIPMPHFNWEEDDVGHAVSFLPLVGIVIGLLEIAVWKVCQNFGLPELVRLAVCTLIPLFITGGFHVDGFLDVEDALSSYKPKEEKLLILKDPHIGSFAIIRLLMIALVWVCGFSLSCSFYFERSILLFALIFVEIRACGGLLSLYLSHAKKDGMLNMETGKSRADKVLLFIFLGLCLALNIYLDWKLAVLLLLAGVVGSVLFQDRMKKNFGGITGDTIGYYIVTMEVCFTFCLGLYSFLVGR